MNESESFIYFVDDGPSELALLSAQLTTQPSFITISFEEVEKKAFLCNPVSFCGYWPCKNGHIVFFKYHVITWLWVTWLGRLSPLAQNSAKFDRCCPSESEEDRAFFGNHGIIWSISHVTWWVNPLNSCHKDLSKNSKTR